MNDTFGFSYPWVLIAIVVFILLILLYKFFSKLKQLERRLPENLRKKLLLSVFFFRICIVCVIIALASPHWGIAFVSGEYRRGLDVVFAIDLSRSMDIHDVLAANRGTIGNGELSRLEQGLVIARETVMTIPGSRYAAAIGKNRGIAAVPLTWDNEAILSFLESVDSSSITGGGTNLESLLDAASGSFQDSFPSQRVIILVSDGEALSGSLRNALDRCVRDDIIVLSLAIGSDEGRPLSSIAVGEIASAEADIISRRDVDTMRAAAERTGGIYIVGNRDDATGILTAHLRSLAPEKETRNSRPDLKQRSSLFIIIAILAYGASKFVPLLPRRKP